jgi:hypothetical protein
VPIYVETRIHGSLDEVWRRTQTPALHEQWDLRFTSITYLDRASVDEPQRFRYSTRIGMGIAISGWGETIGSHTKDGGRTSALKFGSDERRSLIRAGSGYWKYEQAGDGVRFLTGYDYEVRWGFAGRCVDRLLFRPLIGWATAWSFDRLRMWIVRDIPPSVSLRCAFTHTAAALAVGFVWLWHGLVPKLLAPHSDEVTMLSEAGVAEAWLRPLLGTAIVVEILLGLSCLLLSRRRWPWLVTIVLMLFAMIGVVVNAPHRAIAPFNPVTLNTLMIAAATCALLTRNLVPSAHRCLRRPGKQTRSES